MEENEVAEFWHSYNEVLYLMADDRWLLRTVGLFDGDTTTEIDENAAFRWLARNNHSRSTIPRSIGALLPTDDQIRLQSAISLTGQTKSDFVRQALLNHLDLIESIY